MDEQMQAGPGQEQAAGGGEAGPEQLKQAVVGAHENLLKFQTILSESPNVSDDLKQQLDGIVNGYREFVQNLVGSGGKGTPAQGPQGAPAAPGPKGPAPMMAGAGNVKPAL